MGGRGLHGSIRRGISCLPHQHRHHRPDCNIGHDYGSIGVYRRFRLNYILLLGHAAMLSVIQPRIMFQWRRRLQMNRSVSSRLKSLVYATAMYAVLLLSLHDNSIIIFSQLLVFVPQLPPPPLAQSISCHYIVVPPGLSTTCSP